MYQARHFFLRFLVDAAARIARGRYLLEDRRLVAYDGIDTGSSAIGAGSTGEAIGAGLEGLGVLCTVALTVELIIAVQIAYIAVPRHIFPGCREAGVATLAVEDTPAILAQPLPFVRIHEDAVVSILVNPFCILFAMIVF